ncbi:MAG: Minf_1886 family protein [Planctomycetota bacterium]
MAVELEDRLERAARADGRYPPDAYLFLCRGLELAARKRFGNRRKPGRHVTGQELAEALRILAIQQWGPLAREVLRRWNIHRTRDFGEMVYVLIEEEMFGKQASDDISDFDDVYEFQTAFAGYRVELQPAGEEETGA